MTPVFLFDIDGTLTEPRQPMTALMAEFMRHFAQSVATVLVTGSDWPKVCEQVPEQVRHHCLAIFCCAGAELWRNEQRIAHRPYDFPEGLVDAFKELAFDSPYPIRLGRHVEVRTGLLNVSVVGRNAGTKERSAYRDFDERMGERRRIAARLAKQFPDFDYTIGGDISIDITPRGWSKAQVLPTILEIVPNAAVRFFGDRMGPGGNDAPLAAALARCRGRHLSVPVSGPEHTRALLVTMPEAPRHLRHIAQIDTRAA